MDCHQLRLHALQFLESRDVEVIDIHVRPRTHLQSQDSTYLLLLTTASMPADPSAALGELSRHLSVLLGESPARGGARIQIQWQVHPQGALGAPAEPAAQDWHDTVPVDLFR